MTEAKDKLNKSAAAIEEAQNDIRLLIQRAYLYNYARVYTERALKAIIEKALKSISIARLKRDTVLSLTNYANRQRNIWQNSGITPALLFFLAKRINSDGEADKKVLTERLPNEAIQRDIEQITGKGVETVNKGVPLQRFYGDLWKEKIKPTLEKIASEKALDPNDYTGRNSLRNLAEMEVRYQDHKDEIEELKASGERLVMCSAHADCSERCAPYQGRLYSLDGTSGEIDGIKYVPLEYATNNPKDRYTTKAGRTYQNGLLGFNCFDKETEVYTNDGWKRFCELDGTEMFYTLDKETRRTEWQAAERYYKVRTQDGLIHFKSNTVDLLVTPNHNMLYFTCKDKRLRFAAACDLPKTALIPKDGNEYGKIETVRFEKYEDFVYCVEVPNHTLYVRRNGCESWCGNCRHKLTPYRGQEPEYISEKEREKEYAITKKQRAMERRVRALKAEAEMTKRAKSKEYIKYQRMAKQAYAEYKQYSKENERAYYPMRVSI